MRGQISVFRCLSKLALIVFIVMGVLPAYKVAAAHSHDGGQPVAQLLTSDGSLDVNTGYSGLLDMRGYTVSLDPVRGPLLRPLMTPNAWNALGSGLSNIVYASVIFGSDLYVGGQFTNAGGDANANKIAKWDGSSWSALGSGISNGQVNAIAINGSNLYVGGSFLDAGGNPSADYIAQWDGSTWSGLGNGLNNTVNSIAVSGLNIYVAGNFTNAGGDANADYIAKLDGGTWAALGATPLTGPVNGIAVAGATVYAGGDFLDVGGNPNIDRIARWDGLTWSAMGSGLGATVVTIALSGQDVYVAGLFNDAGGNPSADKIAKWDGTSWSALGSGLNSFVNKIVVNGSNVYAGGNFLNAGGDANADYIARWDGSSWSALGSAPLNNTVASIVISGLDIYVGGIFLDAGNITNADYIVRFEIEATAPTVDSFAATSPANSLSIPITAFSASDNIAVTGYTITESSTPPAATDPGWTASAPTTYSVPSNGSYTLYPWAKDATGNVSAVYGSPANVTVDASAPTVTAFSVPASSTSLSISITSFTASDNVGVTGYTITQSSTPPSAGAAGWTASAPTSYSVSSSGSYTLYPWAKDATGNVSAVYGSPASVNVDNAAPSVTAFSVPSSSSSLNISITSFSASDNVGVTGYRITTSATPPAAGAGGWTASAPTSYTAPSQGIYTLYPWAKDAIGHVSAVYGSPASVRVDTSAPTVSSFAATSSSSSLNIPITTFTASDNVSVTGYTITESSTPPSAGAAGWTGAAPTTYTVVGDGTYTLYPWAKDAAGNVSAVYGSPASVSVDTSAPTVSSFAATSPSASLDIPITAFSASDTVGVTGYLITTSATPPSAGAVDWTGVAPATYTVAGDGTYTLYPWAKDAAGNVSAVYGSPASVRVDTSAPTVSSFAATSPSASLNIPITAFSASDNVAVTGYTITESSIPPPAIAPGWTASAPTTYTVPSDGSYTLYPWAKDAAGNVSAVYGSPASVRVDTSAPTVSSFAATSPSASLAIPITAFSASDAGGVTGYLITTVALPPPAGALGWTASTPTIYAVPGDGSYTLYPWAKDAAGNVSAVYGSPASVTVETTAPSVVSSTRVSATPSNAASVSFLVTFSEPVSGVDASDFSLTSSGVTGASIAGVSGSGTTRTVSVNTGADSGTLRLDMPVSVTVTDLAGNPLNNTPYTSGETYTIDKTAPTVLSSTRANTNSTNTASVDFTITFAESVTGVDISDFSLMSSGVTGAAIAGVSGSGTTRTVSVNTGSGSGTLRLNLLDDDSIADGADNPLGGSGTANGSFLTGESYTIDKTAPTAGGLTAPPITLSGAAIYSFTVSFSDNLAIDSTNLGGGDIRVTGPGGFNQLAALVHVTPAGNGTPRTATYQITAPGGAWDTVDSGTYTVAVEANQIFDSAGNPMVAASLGSFLVNLNHTIYVPLVRR